MARLRRTLARTTLLAIAVVGCGPSAPRLGERGTAILRGATRVEVFRVSPATSFDAQPGDKLIGRHLILARGTEQGPRFASRLAAVLLGPGLTRTDKKCGVQPGVAYRFWKGDESVAVLVCFDCDVACFVDVGRTDEPASNDCLDFDPVRVEMLGLAREAFPADKEIQGLAEKRD
jgi:hypothetical protein